ncbi:MAG: ATP-dependent zinc protease [Candidatus Sericytochromatia bacterium]
MTEILCVGWKEWLKLPALGIQAVEAKIDTGAKTSALHTFDLETWETQAGLRVRFQVHPDRHNSAYSISCEADVIDRRWVSDSGGHQELRYVICTPVVLGDRLWPIEITLTNRENMSYRMLLGRQALRGRLVVDPARSYLHTLFPNSIQNEPL